MENEKDSQRHGGILQKKTLKKRIGVLLKRYLATGLIVIIPLWLTFFVVTILFNLISNFAAPYLIPMLDLFMPDKIWVYRFQKLICFIVAIASICLLGFVTNRVVGKTLLSWLEQFIEKVPLLGTVHSAAKQFVRFVFGKEQNNGFKKVVLIPFPSKGSYSIAFLTGYHEVDGERHVCAFMPTTPNPTTGFLLLFKEEDVKNTNYTIEDAFQFIISMGVISPDKDKRNGKKLTESEIKGNLKKSPF
ncbi:MAG: DUF502 domain-containing protein [Endomicrobium sp.]|jgi:uncharacterized membrane protein|nr:DUF502 domain-containing protein [Endomicrobium sp.]